MNRFLGLFALATALVYGALVYYGLFRLGVESGRLPMFDIRALGYGPTEAEAYLAVLTDEGRRLIAGPIRILDTLFPPMLGLLLALSIWANGRPFLAPVPLGYTAVDLWENATVGAMIHSGDTALATTASNLTQGKYALLLLSLAILWMAWREARARG